jgi:hypothetical protein
MAEVTSSGVVADTLAEVLASLDADFLAEFGTGVDGIDLSPRSYTGRQNPIIARRFVELQQLLVELTGVINPNNAQGVILDFVASLFAETRSPATSATIPARLYGVPGFLVGDRRVRYRRNGTIWRVPLGLTIQADGVVDTDLVSDTSGTTLTDGTIIEAFQDGSDQWTLVDAAPASFFAVESTGDYSAGDTVQSDASLRGLVRLAGRSSGTGTEDGIRRAIYRVSGPNAVIDNNRDIGFNANGVPGKSTEVVFDQGTNADVAQAVYDSFSDTNAWFGTTAVTAYKRDPTTGALDLTKPVEVLVTPVERIEIAWDITIDTTGAEVALPDNAESIVQTAVVTYTNTTLAIGSDVLPAEAAAAIRVALPTSSIPEGNLAVLVGLAGGPPPANLPIAITSRQRARTDAAPQAAEILGLNAQPFNIVSGWSLIMAVDGGSAQSVTMQLSDFVVISAATTLEIATIINTRMTGFVAGVEGGALVIRSSTTGATSSVNILPASTPDLLAAIGMASGTVFGNDGFVTVTII